MILVTMMLQVLILALATLLAANATYTVKYDNLDIDEVLQNDRLIKKYVDCLLEQDACTPDGLELKKNMPDAIETNCEKCSEKQKEGSDKFISHLIDKKPEYWMKLQEKYDPSGNYTRKYLESKNDKSGESKNDDANKSDEDDSKE